MLIWIGVLVLGAFILTFVQARMTAWTLAIAVWITAGWGAQVIAPTTAGIMSFSRRSLLFKTEYLFLW